MNSSAIKRIVDASGVAIIYGILSKSFLSPTSKWNETLLFDSKEKQKIQELEKFQLHLVYEANELIENLNHVLYVELSNIAEKSNNPANHSTTPINLEKWAKKYCSLDIPPLRQETSHDERINDRLRSISPQELTYLLKPTISSNNLPLLRTTNQLVTSVVEQFYRLEDQIVARFTGQQEQVIDTIHSFRSKLYSQSKIGDALVISTLIAQVFACKGFLSLTNRSWTISTTSIPVAVPPVPKALGLAALVPIAVYYIWLPLTERLYNHLASARVLNPLPPTNSVPSPPKVFGVMIPRVPQPNLQPTTFKHISPNIYGHFLPPPIYEPCTDRRDPWKPWSVFVNIIAAPIVEGFVFRKLLLDTLLSSTSPLKAHFLVAVAAVACHVGISAKRDQIYEIKHTLSSAYDINNPPVATRKSLSIQYLPVLIQFSHYITANLPISIALNISILLTNHLLQYEENIDVLFSSIHSCAYLPMIRFLSATNYFLSSVTTNLQKGYDVLFSKSSSTPSRIKFTKELIQKYLKLVHDKETVSETEPILSTDDIIDLQIGLVYHSILTHGHQGPILPPNLAKIQNQRLLLPIPPPFSHRNESGYVNEIFPSTSGILKIGEETDRLFLENYYKGKVDLTTSISLLQEALPNSFVGDSRNLRKLQKNLFYWEENATEEEILDLIQEIQAHVYEKLLRSVDIFRGTRGIWLCLELQGQETVSPEDVVDYYQELEKYLIVIKEREEFFYTGHYGLTPHRLQTIIRRRGKEFPAIVELAESWDKFFQSEEYQKKIRHNGSILSICRQRYFHNLEKGDPSSSSAASSSATTRSGLSSPPPSQPSSPPQS